MIVHLPDDILNKHARNALITLKPSSKSWFSQIRDICLTYNLPHPIQLLDYPPTKEQFRKLAKSRVVDFWEQKFRGEAAILPSLSFFHPEFMSLLKPHQIWVTAGSNPYEVSKAVVQAQLLSARYRSEQLCRHWSSNDQGWCQSPTCFEQVETTEHILVTCPAYQEPRERLKRMWLSSQEPTIHQLASEALSSSPEKFLQFVLDCTVIPSVITAKQIHGQVVFQKLFHLTRTWCFTVHRERMRLLNRWNFR